MKKKNAILPAALTLISLAVCGARADLLTLPEDLTAIEDQAFYADASLDQVILPEGLLTIGEKAFAESGVTAVNLPDSLTFIAEDAFDGTNIAKLSVNEGTYAWGRAVNHGYAGWEYEELSDGTISITGFTHTLSTVTIPRQIHGKRVSAIADEAFSSAECLENVTVPGTVDGIGERAFAQIGTLKSVTLEPGVKTIGSEAFTGCTQLQEVRLAQGLQTIGQSAFQQCPLTQIALPEGLEAIGHMAFAMANLTSVDIPDSVTDIGFGAFGGCGALTEIGIGPGNPNYTASGPLVLDKTGTVLRFCASGVREVTVPENVTRIGDYAFMGCLSLERAVIPAWVESLGEGVFEDCYALTSVEMASEAAFTDLPAYTFFFCTSLTEVMLPSTVTEIGTCAFAGSGLERLVLPTNLEAIGEDAVSSCVNLDTIVFPPYLERLDHVTVRNCSALKHVWLTGSLSYIHEGNFEDCCEMEIVAYGHSYAWTWAEEHSFPVREPDT